MARVPERRGFFPCPPQAAPCYEWFEPFFVPGEHYVPVDGNFNNLTMAIAWAQAHDAEVQKMGVVHCEFVVQYHTSAT